MITFKHDDDNKQFISIIVCSEGTNINSLIEQIKSHYPTLNGLHILFDDSEVLIPLTTGYNYNFSLNELREYIKPIAAATVTHFAVDMDKTTQRYYG